jgi:hypothetical protein
MGNVLGFGLFEDSKKASVDESNQLGARIKKSR